MTVGQLLSLIDSSIENTYPDEVKIQWIRDVDGRVLSDIHNIPPDKIELPQGENDVLALPDSYSKAYLLYIRAMIDFFSGIYTGYSNRYHEYESTLLMYAKYRIRNRE